MLITLNPPQILLTPSNSINSVPLVPDDPNIKFGNVYQINFKTINFGVADNVMFDKTQSTLITEGGATYFLIDEDKIYFIETPPL